MLKCKLNSENGFVKVKARGTPRELASETMALMKIVYNNLAEQTMAAANEYMRTIQASVLDPKSPVFKIL